MSTGAADRFVLRGGEILDGSGSPARSADVLVDRGVVQAVGHLPATVDAAVVDVTGRLVTPGFIDVHSHDDVALLKPGFADPKLTQGVTTNVVGNCGHGCAPIGRDPALLEGYSSPVLGAFPTTPWRSFSQYLEHLAAADLATSAVALVPHGPLRASVAGYERRPLTTGELTEISGALDDALDAGAAGMSLGLMYAPGNCASDAELTALARIVAQHDGILAAHIRSEGDDVLKSLDEFLNIGRRTGARLQLSHLKVVSPANHGRMSELLDYLEQARAQGVDVTADVYPYAAGSTTVAALFPGWTVEHGTSGLLAALADPAQRSQVTAELDQTWTTLENNLLALGAERIRLAGFSRPHNVEHEGAALNDIATARDEDPVTCLCELVLEEDASLTVVLFQMDETDVIEALSWPWSAIGSDGLPTEATYTHPRLYGTFPRVLAKYARDRGVCTVAEAVRRMTSLPAERFHIPGGRVAPGVPADLVVLNQDVLADRATFDEPRRNPDGVEAVFIDGVLASDDGYRRASAGRLIRVGGGERS